MLKILLECNCNIIHLCKSLNSIPHLQIYTAQSLKYEAKFNSNPNSEQKRNYKKGEEQGEERCKERNKKEADEISLEAI
jgi:hypothetical protein